MGHLKDFQVGTNGDPFNGPVNGTVGATTPAAASVTTLAASSTVSGTGFSTYLASPPAIGGTAAAAGSFTTLSASSTVSGTGFSTYLASPPAIGGTAAAAVSSTALSYTTTLTGGTGIVNIGSGQIYKDASGNVGVGTANTSGIRFGVDSGSASLNTNFTSTNASGIYVRFQNSGTSIGDIGGGGSVVSGGTAGDFAVASRSGNLVLGTGSTERARIDSSGNLLVGKTTANAGTAGFEMRATGEVFATNAATTSAITTYHVYSTGAGAFRFYVGLQGQVYATYTTITGISDQRLKENIRDLDDGLEKVMALQPRKFDWKEGKGAGTKDARGFIAQEFETVFPDLIEEWKDPAPEGEEPYKAVRAELIPTLVKAIQEQQAQISSQAAVITTLTERITALESK
jgi:hypothetical protein